MITFRQRITIPDREVAMEQIPLFELPRQKGAPIPLDQKVQTELVNLMAQALVVVHEAHRAKSSDKGGNRDGGNATKSQD
jgi:hypothetical protein